MNCHVHFLRLGRHLSRDCRIRTHFLRYSVPIRCVLPVRVTSGTLSGLRVKETSLALFDGDCDVVL